MIKFKYEDIELCIVEELSFTNSMKEVKYDDITCDFEGYTRADLPVKYQEVTIIEDSVIKAYGYISSYKYDGWNKKITFEVLSPKSYITNRVTNLIAVGKTLNSVVQGLVNSLLTDGYSISGTLSNLMINERKIFQPVDKLLDYLAEKYKFVWYVDELKVIHFIMEDTLKNKTPTYTFDNDSCIQLNVGIDSKEYFNTVYGKNILIYHTSDSDIDPEPIVKGYQTISSGNQVNFTKWVDISRTVGEKLENGTDTIQLLQIYTGTFYYIRYTKSTKTYTISSNLGFEGIDDDNLSKPITLIRHEFYKNIIIGFKVNTNVSLQTVSSDSALKQSVIKYTNVNEVNESKNKISTSGIIEKYIDLKNRWFTVNEITEYIKNLIASNSIQTEIINVTLKDIDLTSYTNLDIGKSISITNDRYLINDTYVIVSITKKQSNNMQEIILECRNSSFLDNYINIFRTPFDQESEEQLLYEINSTYVADTVTINNIYTAKGEQINENL